MKKLFSISILVLASFLMAASSAFAVTVNINGTNYTSPDPYQTYAFISASSNSSDTYPNKINIVDYILSNRLVAEDPHTYTLLNGTSNPIEHWLARGAVSVMINEIAGYKDTNTFGYYTTSNSANRTLIFAGTAGNNATYTFELSPAQDIGFYLGVKNTDGTDNYHYYFTEHLINPSEEIHVAIFQVDNSNTYILGFEDLPLASSDKDYQDMIVSVTISPVPEPSTILLLGLGLIGLAASRRNVKN